MIAKVLEAKTFKEWGGSQITKILCMAGRGEGIWIFSGTTNFTGNNKPRDFKTLTGFFLPCFWAKILVVMCRLWLYTCLQHMLLYDILDISYWY